MSAASIRATYRYAAILRYAAIQFIVLTIVAMVAYAGGTWFDPTTKRYELAGNFLSDLGATHAFSGRANTVSCALFVVALASTGAALVAFVWTWRGFAFDRGRAAIAAHASAWLGTASGLALIGIAVTPFDLALRAHNTFVIAAFGLLACYVATITVVMRRNGIADARLFVNAAYLVLVVGYVLLVLRGPSLSTPHGHTVQAIGQKIVVYGSMLHAIFLTTATRRVLGPGLAAR